MAAQLNQNVTSAQRQVKTRYWHMVAVIAKPILIKDCAKFNKTLMEKELTPAWEIVFIPGQDNTWLPYRLFSIIYRLREAHDQGHAPLDVCSIPQYNLIIETTQIFEKGYLINKKDITSDILLGDDQWWQEFHCMHFETFDPGLVVKRAAEKAHETSKEIAAEKKAMAKAEKRKGKAQEQSDALAQGGPSDLKIRVKQPRQKEIANDDANEQPRGHPSGRSTSPTTGGSRAHSWSSKQAKLTPSEGDARDESGGEDVNINVNVNAVFRLVHRVIVRVPCKEDTIKTKQGIVLHAAGSWRKVTSQRKSGKIRPPTGGHIAQVAVLVDQDVEMASPQAAFVIQIPATAAANENDDDVDGEDDSAELPATINKGKASIL
ncbi:hypothetical protein BDN67DRAFT_1010836 [Paxillus ammoniavirescens]|nr:hypothetical protein BDN67DRAFT_1010836 [Paxillus ammoniavirescens]